MDLDSYIARYTGETRLKRLLSIALVGGVDISQRQRALLLAERQIRRDRNALLYKEFFAPGEVRHRIANPRLYEGIPPFDTGWINETENSNREHRHHLEGRLSTAQSRLHKEAIRAAYLELAEHDIRTGRDSHKIISKALVPGISSDSDKLRKSVTVNGALYRAMDYCATRLQTAEVGLQIIESAMNAGDYAIVNEYAERLGITLKSLRSMNAASNSNSDPYQESLLTEIEVKVQIAKGIERMVSGQYKEAAMVLIPLVLRGSGGGENNNNNNNNNQSSDKDRHLLHWPQVTSPEDVALYAGLMCLVTRDRPMMIALADHPEALELVPAIKELLVHWSRANYAPCMRAFSESSSSSTTTATLSQPLLPMGGVVDIFLTGSRWERLVQTIRETCLVEYLRPYQRVKLESLRDLFFPQGDLDAVIDGIADLMNRKLLPPTTRLDCRANILFQGEAPCDPTPKIRFMEERVLDDSHAMLVRLSCLEHDLAVLGDARGGSGSSKKEGRRQRHGGRIVRKGMVDSSDSDEDDGGGGGVGIYKTQQPSYEDRIEGAGDTHMVDADMSAQAPAQFNSAMNPEDMY